MNKVDVLTNSFVPLVITQLELQGREPNVGPGGHPDSVIRSFNRSALNLINEPPLLEIVEDTHQLRPEMGATHFIGLLFRAVQHSCREGGNISYLRYSDSDWKRYFQADLPLHRTEVQDIMRTHNTATQVMERYRSLNAAIRATQAKVVGDVGCSLGLGLKACFSADYLITPPFTDETPGQQVLNSFNSPIPVACRAIGVDVKLPSLEWVKACNYPTKYDADGAKLDAAVAHLGPNKVKLIEASILDPQLPQIIQPDGKPFDMVHASMSMYELTRADQELALQNISRSLRPDGVFIEFTFKDPNNWFAGIHTIVRQNSPSGLSEPLVWHEWDNSRCTRVWAGKDFETVNQIFKKFRD